ncbi:MAG: hypothetical protein IJU91_06775 [Selenomonadaceae bacterium]|nr:hypothetical protein [Selenomonadaceae bacterium]
MNLKSGERFFEVDVLRGVAIFIMIVVDAPPADIYEILQHAQWEGLTIADLAFPAFVFAMGMSAAISVSRRGVSLKKVISRTITLFLLGLILNEVGYIFAYICMADFTAEQFYSSAVEHLRVFGILQRLALTYFFGIAITQFVQTDKEIFCAAFVLLIASSLGFHVYAAENPFDEVNNISTAIDLFLPGANHIYTPTGDPEGLYGTIASTASMLFGFLAGRILIANSFLRDKIYFMGLFGAVFLICGEVWSLFDIVAKKIWTAPFVLFNAGGAMLLTAVLMQLFDFKPRAKIIFQPLAALGKNPLLMFMASNITVIFLAVNGIWTEMFWLSRTVFQAFTSVELNVLIFVLIWAALWTFTAMLLDKAGVIIKI